MRRHWGTGATGRSHRAGVTARAGRGERRKVPPQSRRIFTLRPIAVCWGMVRVLMRTRRLPRSKKNEYVTACVALDRKGPSPLGRCRTNHARGRDAARMPAHGPIQCANSFRSIRLFLNVKVSRFSFDLMRRTGARVSKSSFHFGGGTACLFCCACCSAACRAIIRLVTSACWSGASTLKISLFSRLCNRSSVTSFWP